MAKNKYKEKNMAMPIEKHDTAAWANIEKTRRVSGTEPGEQQVRNAKDYVMQTRNNHTLYYRY